MKSGNVFEYVKEHIIDHSVFACGLNKAPLTRKGFNDATNDIAILRRQFCRDDLLIGVPTGNDAGFIVLDFDVNKPLEDLNGKRIDPFSIDNRSVDELKDILVNKFGDLPKTFEVETKNGGRHLYYKLPEEGTVLRSSRRTLDKTLPVDLRANGGYVCGVDGKYYTVYGNEDYSSEQFVEQMAMAPKWLLNINENRREPEQQNTLVDHTCNDADYKKIQNALKYIPSDDRDLWIKVGLALKSEKSMNLKSLWLEWSQKSSKFKTEDSEKRWKTFNPDNRIGLGSIFYYAQQYGYGNKVFEDTKIETTAIDTKLHGLINWVEKKKNLTYVSQYSYKNDIGDEVFVNVLFKGIDGFEKIPFHVDVNNKYVMGYPKDIMRPLYRIECLLDNGVSNVVILSTEAEVDTFNALCASIKINIAATTWSGKKTKYTDFLPLQNKKLYVWPNVSEHNSEELVTIYDVIPDALIIDNGNDESAYRKLFLIETEYDFLKLISESKLYSVDNNVDSENGLPVIDITTENIPKITQESWAALVENNDPPFLFTYMNRPVRLERSAKNICSIVELDMYKLRYECARAANWVIKKKVNEEIVTIKKYPYVTIIQDMLADPNVPLPWLHRMVHSPVVSVEGTVINTPGYNSSSGIYYVEGNDTRNISIKESPTTEDIKDALSTIEIFLCDFNFAEESDRVNAIGLMILPFVQELIDGAMPLHLIQASCPGTGKGLLTDCCLYPATGGIYSMMAPANDEEEWRKRITSSMVSGNDVILIDNINSLDSVSLASVITTSSWSDRILGKSQIVKLVSRNIWVATGNNPILSTEMARRTVPIRLVAQNEKPWLRTEFKNPDLRLWMKANRHKLISSILTIVSAWISDGKPASNGRTLGSFEQWSRVIGGILNNVGLKGFLDNINSFYENTDDEGDGFRELVVEWFQQHETKVVGVAEIFLIANRIDKIILRGNNDNSQKKSLGMKISKYRDRIFDNLKITSAGSRHGVSQWKLVKLL